MNIKGREKMYVVRVSDGLGNQMFQYAFARKLQILSKKKVYLDTRFINHEDISMYAKINSFYKKCDYRKYGLNHFKIILPEANENIVKRWKFIEKHSEKDKLLCKLAQTHVWFSWYNEESMKEGMFNLSDCICPTYFQGYFFDIRYFYDIRNLLCKEFCVKKSINLIPELCTILNTENTVGVHIRKGDFSKLSRDISQTEYYPKAMKRIKEEITNPFYLVFSDDVEWVKNNIEIKEKKIYVSEIGYSDFEELTIMKYCKHNIIANSTFSYWAAYLNNNPKKIVICPKRWKNNIIPKEWVHI